MIIRPNSTQQAQFLASPADWALYGGGTGGGKTAALAMFPLMFCDVGGWRGAMFRRAAKDHVMPGGTLEECRKFWCHRGGARVTESGKPDARWPSGARVAFDYPERTGTYEEQFQGLQVVCGLFDEATHFDYDFISYIWGRCRNSNHRLRPCIRMSCNPDPDHWLARWVDPFYLDESGYPDYSKSGRVRWWARERGGDDLVWGNSRAEVAQRTGRPLGQVFSFAFYPALASDNPDVDDEYADRVSTTSVRESRLKYGNWRVREDTQGMLREELWDICEPADVPGLVWRARCWDRGASQPTKPGDDPDYSCSVLVGGAESGRVFVGLGPRGVTALRENPAPVFAHMRGVAMGDGPSVIQSLPIEPAAAGKDSQHTTTQVLQGQGIGRLHWWQQRGDKRVRATPLSRALEKRTVTLVVGPWFSEAYRDAGQPKTTLGSLWWSQINPFPDGRHDDFGDAVAGAFNAGQEGGAFSGGSKATLAEIRQRLTQRRGRRGW